MARCQTNLAPRMRFFKFAASSICSSPQQLLIIVPRVLNLPEVPGHARELNHLPVSSTQRSSSSGQHVLSYTSASLNFRLKSSDSNFKFFSSTSS